MKNSLVEDNSGVISNYVVDKDKDRIYVMYLDGETFTIANTEENIKELTETMINQAIKAINLRKDPKYIQLKKGEIFKDSIFASIAAIFIFGAIELALKEPNSVRITMEAVATMVGVPVAAFMYKNGVNCEIDNEYKKYYIYLQYYGLFDAHKHNAFLYDGVEHKGAIDINTLDNYTYEEVLKMFDNLQVLTNKNRERYRTEANR